MNPTRHGDSASVEPEHAKRVLDRRAFVAIVGATLTSTASVLLISPFFASHGAEVNPFTTAILAGQVPLFGVWCYAAWAYARAKGYGRVDRLLPLWGLVALDLVANLLKGEPITSLVRGRTVYSTECAVAFLILGLAGATLAIAIAALPDLQRRALVARTDAGTGETDRSPWAERRIEP